MNAPRFMLWRQDDNGQRFEVAGFETRDEADRARATYEARGHKQMYEVLPAEAELAALDQLAGLGWQPKVLPVTSTEGRVIGLRKPVTLESARIVADSWQELVRKIKEADGV